MKKIYLQILLLVVINFGLIAQTSSYKTYDMKNKTHVENKYEIKKAGFFENIPERVITTGVVVGEILILLFVLYYWKKTRDDSKSGSSNIYKNNIKAIRNERISPILIMNKHKNRKALKKSVNYSSINGSTISRKAKKLSVAKGELFLATRINQLEKQYK